MQNFFDYLEHGEFGPDTEFKDWLMDLLCHDIDPYICSNMMFLLFGFDQAQMNMTLIDKINHHSPAGTSVKSVVRKCRSFYIEILRLFVAGSVHGSLLSG